MTQLPNTDSKVNIHIIARATAAKDTHSNTPERAQMPVPEPVAPQFPQASVHQGLLRLSSDTTADSTSHSDPEEDIESDSTLESGSTTSRSEETPRDEEDEEDEEDEDEDELEEEDNMPSSANVSGMFHNARRVVITGGSFSNICGTSPNVSGSWFGNKWPFGPEDNPFEEEATSESGSGPCSSRPKRKHQSTSSANIDAPNTTASNHYFKRRRTVINMTGNLDHGGKRGYNSSCSTSNTNLFASFGGDEFGNYASGFRVNDRNIPSTNGGIFMNGVSLHTVTTPKRTRVSLRSKNGAYARPPN